MAKAFYFKLFSIILIASLGLIVYSNTFHCPFHFDDNGFIINNPYIRDIQDLSSIWKFYPNRFIIFLSIALNYHFHRLDVFGYHVFNLAVHLITAILVWWLTLMTLATPAFEESPAEKLKQSLKSPIAGHASMIALFAGLVFVSHPVQTEAVTFIWQRAASLVALFYVASLCFYVKSRLLEKTSMTKVFYTFSLITAVVAMFTKENAITLPLTVLLYEFCFLRTKKSFNWGRSIPFLLTLLIIPLTIAFTKSAMSQEISGVVEGTTTGISHVSYLLTQFRVMVTYIRLFFIPIHQNLDYDFPIYKNIFEVSVLTSFIFLITILYFAKRLFSKYRLLSFSIFWFFLTLLPESSFLPLHDVIYEHRLYLPLVGCSMFLVSSAYYLLGKRSLTVMAVVLGMTVGCNSFLAYQRNKIWKDDFTLWNDTVKKSPHKARPRNNRGADYAKQGNLTLAMSDFNEAIEEDPKYAEAYINRGNAYTRQNNLTQAMSDYNKAIGLNTGFAEAYNNRSFIEGKQGDLIRGLLDCNKAIEINSDYAEAYNNCGIIHDKQGDFAQAILDYDKALEITPDYSEAYYNRGNDYSKQGDSIQAMSDYNRAVEIDSRNSGAYNNRGLISEKQGDLNQAMSDYNRAIDIDPKNAEAYNNRGNIENKQGDSTRAIADFTRAIKLDPKSVGAYYNRGSALGKQGHLSQAIADLTQAIELKPDYAEAYDNLAVSYFMLKEYEKAQVNARKAEELGAAVNPEFIRVLNQMTGQGQ